MTEVRPGRPFVFPEARPLLLRLPHRTRTLAQGKHNSLASVRTMAKPLDNVSLILKNRSACNRYRDSRNGFGSVIHPGVHYELLADNNTLLHEMIDQFLFECEEDPKHMGAPWRREIMRLQKQITGQEIWAGPSKPVRQGAKVIRINVPRPVTGEASLTQGEIATWPDSRSGINLGKLGNSELQPTRHGRDMVR